MRANCEWCTKEFDKRGRAKTCGKECSKKRTAERKRQYYEDNREFFLEWFRQYYQDNRETISKQQRQWCEDNREKLLEWNRQYYQDNRETLSDQKRSRRVMLGLEQHGFSSAIFLSHMINQRIASIQDSDARTANTANNKEHQ